MPKKRSHQFKPLQTATSRSSSLRDPSGSTKTVNEKLQQLRVEQAPRLTVEQRNEMTTLATSHTLPPHLRRLLDVPETAPPGPKRGNRRVMRFNGQRPPPGPAAPQSWLAASRHAPAHARRAGQHTSKMRDGRKLRSLLATLDDVQTLPANGSLLDMTLKAMARDWEFIAEYEQLNLATLPIRWKVALLSYLGTCAHEGSVTVSSLRTLFLAEDELTDATGGEDLLRLDLDGIISASFTLDDLGKFLHRDAPKHKVLELSLKHASLPNKHKTPQQSEDGIVDSWEDQASAHVPAISPGLRMKRFPNLTRLSLAHVGAFASWKQLLSISSNLTGLTHLSLAYWPVPTTTPNSKTAFITHNHASIPVSGTHFYNQLDDDWAEAASLLKRLSKNTYRLQWLDLEGCADWLRALIWSVDNRSQNPPNRWIDRTFGQARQSSDAIGTSSAFESDITDTASGPDWNGSWSQLVYLNVSQGTIPRDVASVRAYPAGVVAAELLLWLRDDENTEEEDVRTAKGMDVQQWLQKEKEARHVASTVRALRASTGGAYCKFDHGWTRPVAAATAVFKGSKHND